MEFRYYSSRGYISCLRASESKKNYRPDPSTGRVRIAQRRQESPRSFRIFNVGRRGADGEDPDLSARSHARGVLTAGPQEERPDSGARTLRHGVAHGDVAKHAIPAGERQTVGAGRTRHEV